MKALKETERKVILAYAENNMDTSKTARALTYHRNSVKYHLGRISDKYGLDPRNFYQLTQLVHLAGGADIRCTSPMPSDTNVDTSRDKSIFRICELINEAYKVCRTSKTCLKCPGYGRGSECEQYLIAHTLSNNGVSIELSKTAEEIAEEASYA